MHACLHLLAGTRLLGSTQAPLGQQVPAGEPLCTLPHSYFKFVRSPSGFGLRPNPTQLRAHKLRTWGWPELYICTVYDPMYGDFPAKVPYVTPYI